MDEYYIIEFNITEIFDLSDPFQSRILNACTARNDLVRLFELMTKAEDDSDSLLSLFKFHVSIIRETHHLIQILFEEDKIEQKIPDCSKLKSCFQQYMSLIPLESQSDILVKFLKPTRDITYHYQKPQFKECHTSPISGKITFSDKGRAYLFADSLYYQFITEKWKEYRNLSSTDGVFADLIGWFREVVTATIQLLDTVFDGYCEAYLSIEVNNGKYTFIKKDRV